MGKKAPLSLCPDLRSVAADAVFAELAASLASASGGKRAVRMGAVWDLQEIAIAAAATVEEEAEPRLVAAILVTCDLARQGWILKLNDGVLVAAPPKHLREVMEEKGRVRGQLHVSRDEQLASDASRQFIRKMETQRLFEGRWASIFSLMRDGRDLAAALREANKAPTPQRPEALDSVIQPYLQVVTEGGRCPHTGLLLQDIWRYFRHTWSNAYRTTPGRNVNLIVRDAAAPNHPVIGIAALISSAAQIGIRDDWIGWSSDRVLADMNQRPSAEWAEWLRGVWDRSYRELYSVDLLRDGVLTPAQLQRPTMGVVEHLRAYSAEQRREHERFAETSQHKSTLAVDEDGEPDWRARAETPLYKSKRSLRLADLLRAKMALDAHLAALDEASLRALLATSEGVRAARYLARRAKGEMMGVALADIGVCGSVAPYNHLLGGKLVSMLMASPEVGSMYAQRYEDSDSVIASSTAGRSISRATDLVLLMTTSLYGAGSSQYNRVRIPADRVDGRQGDKITYEERGLTEGFGTSQFSEETVSALSTMLSKSQNGLRVNSFFGEGANPRLRKTREGLDALKLPSEALLQHGSPKVVYAVNLVHNLRRFLLGLDTEPAFRLAQDRPEMRTRQIAAWWRERWLSMRAEKDFVLDRVESETMVHPITHGARVVLPEEDDDQIDLFG